VTIVDSSVILAILLKEDGWRLHVEALMADDCSMAAPTYVEAMMAAVGKGLPSFELDDLLERSAVRIVPFDVEMGEAAIAAFQTYGKGRGHKARLNFGDCLAYAAAKRHGAALLYKGDDFAYTDLPRA
jgi:ribonuclease VapC